MNPLCGWNVSAVRNTGMRYGLDPSGDILGCLFFHIKAELREFSLRVKEFDIHLHLLQYDSRLLSKGISIRVLPAFSGASFDRVDVGDVPDSIRVAECLAGWGTLLNKENKNSSLIMHSKRWHDDVPGAIARGNPRTIYALMERCENVPSLVGLITLVKIHLLNPSIQNAKLKNILRQPQSPSLARLMSSLDAFVDHEDAFLQYLRSQDAEVTGASLGIRLRNIHRVHPKVRQETSLIERYVVGSYHLTIRELESHSRILIESCLICPKTSSMTFVRLVDVSGKRKGIDLTFIDIVTIGCADLAIRFAEFEFIPSSEAF